MAYIYTSEYVGDDNKRKAEVYKHANHTGFTVKCFESTVQIKQEVFNTESQAEDYAEDWVLQDTASE